MIVGIDPGITGAIACLTQDYEFISVHDMPVQVMPNKKKKISALKLTCLLRTFVNTFPFVIFRVEDVHAMPNQGVTSVFSFGESVGVIRGIIVGMGYAVHYVRPQLWKKNAILIGQPKDAAREKAIELFPAAALSRKKDIGRADALLIARYGHKI